MKNWLKVFLLYFVLGLLVYFNSLNNKFLIDDYVFLGNTVMCDTKYILSQWNPYREQSLGVLDSHERLEYYRPMAHMVLDFSYANFKNDYWKYHLLNLILFVFASSLIFLLIQKLTGNYNLALLTGIFYLVHPINGIIVDYISANAFAFQIIFTVGAILLLLESLERENNAVLYSLSLLSCFFSLFWNESGVMTPFYVLAAILFFRKDALREKALSCFPYFLIVFIYIVFRFFFISLNDLILKQIALQHMNSWEYVANLFRVFSWYISQLFYPTGIVMQWATPITHEHIFVYALGGVLFILLFLLIYMKFNQERILQMAIVWIVIGFAPVCLAAFKTPGHGAQIEPHWFIISSIGFFILASYCCLLVLKRMKILGWLSVFILIVSWGIISHANNLLWADQKTYALYWAQQVPDFKTTYYYLGDAYQKEGDLKTSEKYYRMALAGDSSDIDIYTNLAVANQAQGRFKDAERNYKMALKLYPYSAGTLYDLGYLYLVEGQLDKAQENFDRSLLLNPLLLEPRRGLASILIKHAQYQKAVDLCFKDLEIVKDDRKTLLMLLDIFIQEKDLVRLKQYAARYIDVESDPVVITQVGVSLAQNNLPGIALDCFEKALRLDPNYKEAYLDAGVLFYNLAKYDEAIHLWKSGLSIDPFDQRFKKNIAKLEGLKSK